MQTLYVLSACIVANSTGNARAFFGRGSAYGAPARNDVGIRPLVIVRREKLPSDKHRTSAAPKVATSVEPLGKSARAEMARPITITTVEINHARTIWGLKLSTNVAAQAAGMMSRLNTTGAP